MSNASPTRLRSAITTPLGIGRVSRLTGLTVRAIRFYQDRGLVPEIRDARGNRTFDALAVEQLVQIAQLRAVEIGLPEIRSLLESQARSEGGRDLIHLHALLRDQYDRRRAQLAALEAVAERIGLDLGGDLPGTDRQAGGQPGDGRLSKKVLDSVG